MAVDGDDLEALFRREYAPLVRAMTVVLGDREAANDTVQDAFLQASRHWSAVSRYDNPAGWLRRVAVNRALDERRGQRRRTAAIPRLVEASSAVDDEPAFDFDAALAELPVRQRAVVALYYVADLPVAEIAALLGVVAGTVKSQLHDARRALAPELEVDDGHR